MRHFTRDRSPFRVRLACVKHAASVQSEPESNSPVQICSKDLRWTEIRISKFLPVRYSLVNEPHRFTRREVAVYATSFSLSTSFFYSRKFFSWPRRGNSLARGRLMSHFQTCVKNFFAIRENFFSRRPFGRGQLVGANGFMRLLDPTVKHFSAKKFTDLRLADCLFNQHTEKTQKNVCILFKQHTAPKKSRYRQCRNGALAMHPPSCLSAHLRYNATKLPAEPPWQLPLPAHRWRRTPNDSTLPRLPPATSGPLVRPYPAALFGHKKAGKGLPFPACHG